MGHILLAYFREAPISSEDTLWGASMFRALGIVAALALASAVGACATAKEPERQIEIAIGPDGKMSVVMPENATAEDLAMAQLMQAALDGELDAADEADALSEDQIWRQDPDGNLSHLQSGVTCPAVWGALKRTDAHVFRGDGMDVGCNYSSNSSPTVMTFYAFTLPEATALSDLMQETMAAIKTRQPLAKDAPYLSKGRGQYEAQTLAYDNADGSKMRTSLLMTKVGDWFLKIRLTCRAVDAPVAEETAGLAIIGQADRLRNPPAPKTARPDPV